MITALLVHFVSWGNAASNRYIWNAASLSLTFTWSFSVFLNMRMRQLINRTSSFKHPASQLINRPLVKHPLINRPLVKHPYRTCICVRIYTALLLLNQYTFQNFIILHMHTVFPTVYNYRWVHSYMQNALHSSTIHLFHALHSYNTSALHSSTIHLFHNIHRHCVTVMRSWSK